MHIREIKTINGIQTIISKSIINSSITVVWDGLKWVEDAPLLYNTEQMLRKIKEYESE